MDVIRFTNFYDLNSNGFFDPVIAFAISSFSITIPSQVIGPYMFSGSGQLDTLNHVLNVTYDVEFNSSSDFCTASFQLQ